MDHPPTFYSKIGRSSEISFKGIFFFFNFSPPSLFYRISLLSQDKFFICRVCGGWCPTFCFFKPHDNNVVYTFCVDVYYIPIKISANKFCYGFNIFHKVETWPTQITITKYRRFLEIILKVSDLRHNLK